MIPATYLTTIRIKIGANRDGGADEPLMRGPDDGFSAHRRVSQNRHVFPELKTRTIPL
jgi:hypothetical protein